jgi:uncharacterized protein YybS (DUF2232 family)
MLSNVRVIWLFCHLRPNQSDNFLIFFTFFAKSREKDINTKIVQVKHLIFGSALSLFLGFFFTYIVGEFDSPQYLLELMTIILIELPFVACFAVFARKFDWMISSVYALMGTAVSFALIYPGNPLTYLVFIKVAVTGIILGKTGWFGGSFPRRLSGVTLPGFVFALIFGLPIVIRGVSPEILEVIKEDTLQIYQAVMTEDNARNTLENAMFFFDQIFKLAFAFYVLFGVVLSWLSFQLANIVLRKFNEPAERIPPFYAFKMPFSAIWVLLFGGVIFVIGYKPSIPLASNILAAMAGLYGMQGLAIVTYHINRISIGRLPKVIFWVIFFLTFAFFSVFLIIIGIFDNWFNLRYSPEFSTHGERGNDNEDYT